MIHTHLLASLLSALPAMISVYSSCSFCSISNNRFSDMVPIIMIVEEEPWGGEG